MWLIFFMVLIKLLPILGTISGFFFQAEDGIRDVAVTGVQTCALPIWAAAQVFADRGLVRKVDDYGQYAELELAAGADPQQILQRSEERRVGEEGRSRWSPDH